MFIDLGPLIDALVQAREAKRRLAELRRERFECDEGLRRLRRAHEDASGQVFEGEVREVFEPEALPAPKG